MRKTIIGSVLALALMIGFVPVSGAEMAKEGSSTGTYYYNCSRDTAPIDENRAVAAYECVGAMVSDFGEGPLHNTSTRNFGVIYFERGVGRLEGYVISTDPDGDKTVVEIREGHILPPPIASSVTGNFIGGTEKFEGITGTLEYKQWYVKPPGETTGQDFAKIKCTWKLP